MWTQLKVRNRRMIDAIVEKANAVCPGALAMIGVYGSFATGDMHARSDLDLLVLINDDRGWQLRCTFIQDDLQVGHDIYCTTWESLRKDAQYEHPDISKLMDCEIVYCADEAYRLELETLRRRARERLTSPFSEEDYRRAESVLKQAEHHYAMAMTAEEMPDALEQAGDALYFIRSAVAMLNKRYFHCGTARTYEELEAMPRRPEKLCERMESVIASENPAQVRERLTLLMKELFASFREAKEALTAPGKPATAENIGGTYEEMYSNWRNKMYVAAETGNRYLAMMSLVSMNAMLSDIAVETDVGTYALFGGYDSKNLLQTAQACDGILDEYLKVYERAGVKPRHYADIDDFLLDYQRDCGE